MKKVIVIGAGGQGKVVADIIRLSGDEVFAFLDDSVEKKCNGFNIIGTTSDIGKWKDCWYFAAIGDAAVRKNIMDKDVLWYTAIHPSAVVANDVKIGEGSALMANSSVNPGSIIGKGCIINTGATVDHDCVLEDFVHISPGAHICGTVRICRGTWVGAGATVINNISICSGCIIGAGAAVVKKLSIPGLYMGVPAVKIIRKENMSRQNNKL